MTPETCQTLEAKARAVVQRLAGAGHRALWAGGCVRDRLLGRPFKDIDIATSARPGEVEALFPRSVPVGKAFGVITVLLEDAAFDVATFRREADYADGRRPEAVSFCEEREDALRRDFTVNGLFYDPIASQVLDYVEGQADLARRTIRAIGNPVDRFGEDHLRMLRAVRFASVLEFAIEPDTRAAIQRLAPSLARISAERIQSELTRLLMESPRPGQGLLLLRETGLLRVVLPEVEALAGQEQPPEFHPEGDVLTHTAMMLDLVEPSRRTPELMYAVLLHDVGKPSTAYRGQWPDGRPRIRFDRHDRVGAEMAEQILTRLRLPLRVTEATVRAVANHMHFTDVAHMRRATLRRLVGAPTYPMERELHRVDCLASHGDVSNLALLDRFEEEWQKEPVLPPPLVRGADLLERGWRESPALGRVLKALYDRQLENPDLTRDALLQEIPPAENNA